MKLTTRRAKELLGTVKPRDEVGRLRRRLTAEKIAELQVLDRQLAAVELEIRELVKRTPTNLQRIYGIGPVITAMILGEVGDVARFKTRHHFASYNASAPDDHGSAGRPVHCVNLKGNRRLNHALHMAAITQIRNRTEGRAYYDRKIAEGKTGKEALRSLKRRISDAVYRQLVIDAEQAEWGPGGQTGTTPMTSVTGPTPTAGSSVRPQPGPRRKATPMPAA